MGVMNTIKSKLQLQKRRDVIDRIDRELVQSLCERSKFSTQKDQDDPACGTEAIDKIVALNPSPLSESMLRAVYQELIFAEQGEGFVCPETVDSAAIDAIDQKILQLLSERVQQAFEIGKIKHARGADYYDPTREAQVMAKIVKLNPGPLSNAALQTIYREIISGSIALEKKLAIAYLGPEATYTEQAARKVTGHGMIGAKALAATQSVGLREEADGGQAAEHLRAREASDALLSAAGYHRVECPGCGATIW